MTNIFSDDARYLATAILAAPAVAASFDDRMNAAIDYAFAAAGITTPSEHMIASVRFTAEVCFGGGDTITDAATEGVATWAHLA